MTAATAAEEWDAFATPLGLPTFRNLTAPAALAVLDAHIDDDTLTALARYAATRRHAATAGHHLPPPNRSST